MLCAKTQEVRLRRAWLRLLLPFRAKSSCSPHFEIKEALAPSTQACLLRVALSIMVVKIWLGYWGNLHSTSGTRAPPQANWCLLQILRTGQGFVYGSSSLTRRSMHPISGNAIHVSHHGNELCRTGVIYGRPVGMEVTL
jgi:hypothetical protein